MSGDGVTKQAGLAAQPAQTAGSPADMRTGCRAAGFFSVPVRIALAWLVLLLTCVACLAVGRYPLSVWEVLRFIAAQWGMVDMPPERQDFLSNLIVDIRLPRILAAVIVGAALSTSGAAYQAVFRNPLVSPGLMGVLAGAAFGAALGIVLSGNWWVVQVSAFAMGVVAVAFGLGVASIFGRSSLVMLVLGGVISSGLFAALLSITKYLADPQDQLPAIVYWLMGSLALANLDNVARMAVPMCLSVAVMLALARGLDALSMGDDEARALGVPVHAVRYAVIGAATLASALTVSLAGMIGWIGLLVPHIARLLVGPANSRLLPASAALGALFLLAADVLARTLGPAEIPIGIVTELLGIPVFILVLHRVRKGWT